MDLFEEDLYFQALHGKFGRSTDGGGGSGGGGDGDGVFEQMLYALCGLRRSA